MLLLAAHVRQIAPALAAGGIPRVLHAVPAAQRAHVADAIHGAFATAMNDIMVVAGLLALAGSALALALVRGRDFVVQPSPEPAPAPVS